MRDHGATDVPARAGTRLVTRLVMPDVVVVGAGPTGLALACQLVRWGVKFRIIDEQANRVEESRAFGVQARSMEIFDQLGLGEAFAARARRADAARFHVHGREVARLTFGGIGKDTRYPALYLLPQPDTEQLLIDDLTARGVTIERRVRLVDFRQDREGVTAELVHVDRAEHEIVRCTYLVGCDGAHSRVRDVLGIPFEGATYEQEFVLADAQLDPQPSGLDVYLGRGALVLAAGVGARTRVMGARFDAPPGDPSEPVSIGELAALLRAAQVPFDVPGAEWMSRFRLHHRATRRYQVGHAFLAGDACHIHTPAGGQGMNTGIQDATNLAWKLALVLRGAPVDLLDTYEQERQRIGEVLVHTTDRAFGMLTARGAFARWLRDVIAPHALPLVLASPHVRARLERFISELDIRYHANRFVREVAHGADRAFRTGLAAGRRVPDLELEGVALHDLLRGPVLHVLAFGACDDHELRAIERRHAWRVRIHRITAASDARPLFERFGVTSAATYVVRPDGYVGFRSFGPSPIEAGLYLDALLGEPPWLETIGPDTFVESRPA
jgi:2-polyprenyl-6-methoxyphenol hydroxylase-like FAD-dependent oxidoreductase